jgi:hypothetical protein
LEKSIGAIKWLRQSVLKISASKKEICLFCKNEVALVSIKTKNTEVISCDSMNVVRVIQDFVGQGT